MSQQQVAESLGVSRQAVAKWESGEAQGIPIGPKGKYMFGMVTVGDKGQIVIPAKARKIFDIKTGDKLIVLGDIEQDLAMVKADFITDFFHRKR